MLFRLLACYLLHLTVLSLQPCKKNLVHRTYFIYRGIRTKLATFLAIFFRPIGISVTEKADQSYIVFLLSS